MMRFFLVVFLLAGGSALAQAPASKPAAPPVAANGAAPTLTSAPALTPSQAQQALDVLTDPARRDQTIAVLRSLAKVAPPAPSGTAAAAAPAPGDAKPPTANPSAANPPAANTPTANPPAATIVPPALAEAVAPDSLGAELVLGASKQLAELSDEVVSAARAVTDFPLLWRFVVHLATDPATQAQLLDTSWRLALALAAALLAQAAVRRLLRRPAHALAATAREARRDPLPESVTGIAAAEAGHTEPAAAHSAGPQPRLLPLHQAVNLMRRLPFAVARLLLDLLPVAALLGGGYAAMAAGVGTNPVARIVILGVLEAYAACRVATSISRMLFGPGRPRLFRIDEKPARYILVWVRQIAAIAAFGTALAEIGLLFGMYRLAHDALLKLVVLAVHVCLIIIVLQTRVPVADWIRGHDRRVGTLPRLRRFLADIWHIIAIIYLLAMWLIWALDVQGGFGRLLHLTFATALVLGVSRLVSKLALAWLDRATRIPAEMAHRYPGLESRVSSYNPLARMAIKCLIAALTIVALAEAWGFDAAGWFTGGALGGRLVSSLAAIAVTVAIGLIVWEATNAAIQQHLAKLARESQYARSARLRTLLPMVRTTLLVAILLFAGLMVLSELGVNIAPLLAGAGVIGIAVGFGSQKLVQDIITGLFLLLENAMQVGDVVTLGGLTGTVENLSVRTIRLRALDGAVHIIPFSAVTTVTNATRDFAFAVLDIPVGLNEQPDHIADLLRDIAATMRAEDRWSSAIRDDLDVMGVDKFLDNAWVMRIRLKTLPSQRWPVQRELNRRIKYRFDKDAIESPLTSYRVLHQLPPGFIPLPELPPPTNPA